MIILKKERLFEGLVPVGTWTEILKGSYKAARFLPSKKAWAVTLDHPVVSMNSSIFSVLSSGNIMKFDKYTATKVTSITYSGNNGLSYLIDFADGCTLNLDSVV